jgi:hypothetical protein
LDAGTAGEGELLSADTAPLCLAGLETESASGLRAFDFDIQIQPFRLNTESAREYGKSVSTRQAGKCFFYGCNADRMPA